MQAAEGLAERGDTMSTRPLTIIVMRSEPMSAPSMLPDPPNRLVPPITTPARTVRRSLDPNV
jgi:hypothetical protein